MYVMAALLVVAFFANLAVSPVSAKHIEQRKPRDRMSKPVHV
jgi:hypothetical protein